jgi:arylformamidase
MKETTHKKYFDLTPEISANLAVFPGDREFSRQVILDMQKGDNLTLSNMTASLHLGAHADAPNHYAAKGVGIAERSLNYYKGAAQVVRIAIKQGERVTPRHFQNVPIQAPRILIYTGTFLNPNEWRNDFAALSPELIEFLAKREVILVGIDTPSIDLADDKVLDTHTAVADNDMAILEGLILEHVPVGVYELVALPLKIKDADASPVRAVLFEI